MRNFIKIEKVFYNVWKSKNSENWKVKTTLKCKSFWTCNSYEASLFKTIKQNGFRSILSIHGAPCEFFVLRRSKVTFIKIAEH